MQKLKNNEKMIQTIDMFVTDNWNTLCRAAKYIFGILCICGLIFVAARLVYNYQRTAMMRRVMAQVEQLVANIRTLYTMQYDSPQDLVQELQIREVLPAEMFVDGKIKTPYGGVVAVQSSHDVESIKNGQMLPSFKLSYQGLTHRQCVDLATMNWGNERNGLLATAVGYINRNKVDTALFDIDRQFKIGQIYIIRDKQGNFRFAKEPVKYQFNVAKPDDSFMPTPLTFTQANAGCLCSKHANCSFALRYLAR